MATHQPTSTYRTIFVSDLHLGTKEARAEAALEFVARHPCDYLYLVGDIFDGWALRRSWYWPSSHNAVIQELLEIAAGATEVRYIPGNHDEVARNFLDLRLGGILIEGQSVHRTADGRELAVIHGDEFDGVLRSAKWLSMLGSISYAGLLKLNRLVNHVRGWMGLSYWSFSSFLKYKTKRAVQYIADFEDLVLEKAAREEVDGIVCGHIHHPELSRVGDILYANTGDWVESCTALVEHHDGTLELLRANRDRHLPTPGAAHQQGDGARTEPLIGNDEAAKYNVQDAVL